MGDDCKKSYEKGFLLKLYKSKNELVAALSPKRVIQIVPSVNLYFDFDKAGLHPETERQLKSLLEAMKDKELRCCKFLLIGHTCSIGTRAYNLGLSERGANEVAMWLIDNGILKRRLISIGFGEERSIGDNRTVEGRGLNQRVELRTAGMIVVGRRGLNGNEGMRLLKDGEDFFNEESYQKAASLFGRALKVFKEDNFVGGVRAALMDLSLAYRFLGNKKKAFFYLKRFSELE